MIDSADLRFPALDKLIPIGGVATVAGLGAWFAGYGSNRDVALQGLLYGWVFWTCLGLGCTGLVILHNSLRNRWALAVQNLLEAGAKTVVFFGAIYILAMLALGMSHLYHWMDPEVVAKDPILQHKARFYLNVPFFWARIALYFAVWALLTGLLVGWTRKQEATGDASLAGKRASLGGPGLVIFMLTCTFAFTDWVMSLDPHWFSTIYGVWFVVGAALSATSLVTFIATAARKSKPFSEVVTPRLTRDLGNLMLALTMFWAYISLSQYLIIWSGNLPEEITFYMRRTAPGFSNLAVFLVTFQFLVPFVLLLSPRVKREPNRLMLVSGWIFLVRILDVFWVVLPTFRTTGFVFQWTDVAGFIGLGGVWVLLFALNLRGKAILPTYEPRLMEATDHA